jgi:hypothetical protein
MRRLGHPDGTTMNVTISHHVDASEPDEQGFYDYHYEYDIYRFLGDGRCYFARSYVHEPEQAHFLSCQEGADSNLLGPDHLKDPLLADAVKYLRGLGKTRFERLSGSGYVPLEGAEFA